MINMMINTGHIENRGTRAWWEKGGKTGSGGVNRRYLAHSI